MSPGHPPAVGTAGPSSAAVTRKEEHRDVRGGQGFGEVAHLAVHASFVEIKTFDDLEPVLLQRDADVGATFSGSSAGKMIGRVADDRATRLWACAADAIIEITSNNTNKPTCCIAVLQIGTSPFGRSDCRPCRACHPDRGDDQNRCKQNSNQARTAATSRTSLVTSGRGTARPAPPTTVSAMPSTICRHVSNLA